MRASLRYLRLLGALARYGLARELAFRGNFLAKLAVEIIWLGILIGSTIGGFIPELWGADMISYSSLLLSGVGAFAGLWIGYRMS